MSWSKGFFRLWVVLTLIWLVAVFALLGKDEFKGLWKPNVELEVEYKGVIKEVLDSSRSVADLRRQIIDGVRRGAAQLQRTDPADAKKQLDGAEGTADELLKIMADGNQKRADQLQKGLAILLIPPTALLILGMAIAWIASGFRRTS